VLVQPFQRRVLSYTPTNPPGFQVEMGNIGQHYYQWRYLTNPGSADTPVPGAESTITATLSASTAMTGTPAASITAGPATTTATHGSSSVGVAGTSGKLAISSVQLGTVTDTAFSLTFKTSAAATSEILYGTTSHSYTSHQDISITAAQDHAITLTDLQPGTKYYFALRATADGTSVQGKEDFFTTAGPANKMTATSPTPTKTEKPFTPTPTDKATNTPKPSSSTATMQPQFARVTLSHVVIGAGIAAQLAPSVIQLESATVALSIAYDGSSNAVTDTARPTDWIRDPTNATASSTTAFSPLSLTDKQTTLTLTATATVPFVDTTVPPLTVTFSRKISPSEYASGMLITSPSLSNARSPGYNVVLTFSVALGG
ncbi:MAG: fibronectin type III domain-containing protein, partial [Thermomicrobiales bacterium]